MTTKYSVTLLGPSYLMYGDETGNTEAVAIFTNFSTHPPNISPVPLNKNTFVQVGGMQIGGPTLTQINIADPPSDLIIPLHPERDLEAGPYAWAVLQPPSSNSPPDVYELHVFFEGKDEVVKFTNAIPNPEEVSPIIHPTSLDDGAVYNDLDAGTLSVSWGVFGRVPTTTPSVGRGEDTGGVFSGAIFSYNVIDESGILQKWGPNESIKTNKGLPVIVYSGTKGPELAIFAESGPPTIVELFKI